MLVFSINFLLGILLFLYQYQLFFLLLLGSVFAVFLWQKNQLNTSKKSLLLLLGLVLGFVFSWMNIAYIQNNKISSQYLNKPITIIGTIKQVVAISDQKSVFMFQTQQPIAAKLKLSWYHNNPEQKPHLKTGQFWHLTAKLKQNNGLSNEVGFDYEKSLFIKRISATGYIRTNKTARNQLIQQSNQNLLEQFREYVQHRLSPYLLPLENGGVLYALISGKRIHIDNIQWQRFINSNTSHLTVVSGLHIGLISGLMFWIALRLYRLCSRCCLRLPAPVFAAYVGIFSAFSYALFAGFSTSSQRAFVMASLVFLNIILRRNTNIWQLYGMALFLVLLLEPLSALSVGFWLSFLAVALIIYGIKHYQNKGKIWRMLFIQLLLSLAMLPLLFWFFNAGSAASFFANLVAIPLMSIITLPMSLLGAFFAIINLSQLAEFSFYLGDISLKWLNQYLDFLWQWSQFLWLEYSYASPMVFVVFILGVGLLFLPSGLKLRWLGLFVIAPLLLMQNKTSLEHKTIQLIVFDSGQGLASLILTKNHTLLFDAGFASRSGFNIGDAVIVPYLKKNHIKQLDTVIISHKDNDHIGGFSAVQKSVDIKTIITSATHKIPNSKLCQAGQSWQYDGINFSLLSPGKILDKKDNNNSCVLRIDNGDVSILLTGDIEQRSEKSLLKHYGKKLKSTLLVVPHHGSKTSSSLAFLQAVNPKIALNSAGFFNRFKHPHPDVLNRYKTQNIHWYDTQCSGQISLIINQDIAIKQHRLNHHTYWTRQC